MIHAIWYYTQSKITVQMLVIQLASDIQASMYIVSILSYNVAPSMKPDLQSIIRVMLPNNEWLLGPCLQALKRRSFVARYNTLH